MKDIFGTGREPACDTDQHSPMRRKLLKACAYLPTAPLLAMLGGCDGDDSTSGSGPSGDTSTFTPPVTPQVELPLGKPTVTVIEEKLHLNIPPFSETNSGINPVVPYREAPDPIEEEWRPRPIHHVKQGDVAQPRPPAPVKPKKVGIYSLQYHSFKQISARRVVEEGTPGSVKLADPKDKTKITVYEGIESYLKRSLDNRFALLYRAMVTAFERRSPIEFEVSFVTAPEFYWNVPFGDFWTKEELEFGADLCLNTVTKHVKTLIKKFPAAQYGLIVLLPGTIAMLKPMVDPRKPNGTAHTGTIYEAFNHVVCTHNLPLNDGAKRPAYMIWPKRTVSYIDYFDELEGRSCSRPPTNTLMPNPVNPDLMRDGLKNPVIDCVISAKDNLKVRIGYVSSSVGRSYDSDDKLVSGKFQNNIIEGLPFGIDICLDYSTASVQQDQRRIAQLDERNFKLDFLLAAGMPLDETNYANTPNIQYAIRNEGIGGSTGLVEIWKLTWKPGKPGKPGKGAPPGSAGVGSPSKTDLKRLDTEIAVDQTQTYKAPEGADTTDIPNILDKMNAGLVSVWSLDIDQPANAVVASNPVSTKTVTDKAIQFVK